VEVVATDVDHDFRHVPARDLLGHAPGLSARQHLFGRLAGIRPVVGVAGAAAVAPRAPRAEIDATEPRQQLDPISCRGGEGAAATVVALVLIREAVTEHGDAGSPRGHARRY